MADKDDKEETVRITIDLPKSLHTRFSVAVARLQVSKAEVIRQNVKVWLQKVEDFTNLADEKD